MLGKSQHVKLLVSEGLNSVETYWDTQYINACAEVSEGLNSVETNYSSHVLRSISQFQKDLIVWKHIKESIMYMV